MSSAAATAMRRAAAISCAALVTSTAPGLGRSETDSESGACADDAGLLAGPARITLFEGDVGIPLPACPRTELTAGARGGALIDEPAFFGTLDAAIRVGGSYRYGDAGDIAASLELPRFRFVQNATITGTAFDLGWASVGATHRVLADGSLRVAGAGRLSTPAGASSYESAWPVYGELGAAAQLRASRALAAHGYAGVITGVALGRGPTGLRAAAQARGGAAYRLGRVALIVDTGALIGYGAGLDHLDVAPGVRVRAGRDLAAELVASIPVAGETRTDLAAALHLTWRL